MNLKATLLKLGFVCLLIGAGFGASAQISVGNPGTLAVTGANATEKVKAIFCPTNTFSLTASANDGGTPAITFTSYLWTEVNSSGGGDPIAGLSPAQSQVAQITLTNITPGYHKYRVRGLVDNGDGVICQSDTEEEFVVFVLPALAPDAALADATDVLKYCTNDVPSTAPKSIILTAAPKFAAALPTPAQGLANPTVSEFILQYQWYKVSGATRTAVGTNSSSYTVTDTEVGTFKYEVDVKYDVKVACGAYTAVTKVTLAGGVDAEITVTPKPGKPTITLTP